MKNQLASMSVALVALALLSSIARADERTITIADGKLSLQVPEAWKIVQPRVRIIEHEFSVPPAEGDETPGRLTIMGAGGTVQANVDRWVGQFSQPDGGKTEAKTEKKTIAGQDVHLIELAGTYADSPGPFAPAVQRPGYRMLAAIIMTKGSGNYFVKFYGPDKTVSAQAQAFRDMIAGLTAK